MDKFERFASTEATIRRYLTSLVNLEARYAGARLEEVAAGKIGKEPFLISRGIEKEMQIVVNKMRAIEARHNRYAAMAMKIDMVSRIIREEQVFVRAKIVLDKIIARSEAIKIGMRNKAEEIEEFQGGFSPTKAKQEGIIDSIALIENFRNKRKEAIVENANNSILDALKTAPRKEKTEEETTENG